MCFAQNTRVPTQCNIVNSLHFCFLLRIYVYCKLCVMSAIITFSRNLSVNAALHCKQLTNQIRMSA